ncbi:SCP-like protein [Dictyocaulus viviparus]|uniref:SCP-like protein n=1 Tax=Dictyocaulus viviparus TaxID=29172 RepID=A0A0D8Y6A1_DICVI|nr:SCP-like protein [Dictyocaulus viviparus]
MDETLRMIVTLAHNTLRSKLAKGQQENGRHSNNKKFPTAKHMNLLKYDCALEKAAQEIATTCRSSSRSNFQYLGSNNYTYSLGGSVNSTKLFDEITILEFITRWWNESTMQSSLINLAPSQKDKKMISFLQMANAATTRFGCAYNICNPDGPSAYVSFTCQYSEPYIKIGTPIYSIGLPCSTCKSRCVLSSLCDN